MLRILVSLWRGELTIRLFNAVSVFLSQFDFSFGIICSKPGDATHAALMRDYAFYSIIMICCYLPMVGKRFSTCCWADANLPLISESVLSKQYLIALFVPLRRGRCWLPMNLPAGFSTGRTLSSIEIFCRGNIWRIFGIQDQSIKDAVVYEHGRRWCCTTVETVLAHIAAALACLSVLMSIVPLIS